MKAHVSFLHLARTLSIALALLAAGTSGAVAQAPPDLDVPSGIMHVQLPEDGILHYGTVGIHTGGELRFVRNAANTPVYLLATGTIVIENGGIIRVDGQDANGANPGIGGPGGFAGGNAGFGGQGIPPGNGEGPGGGRGGTPHYCCDPADRAGMGAFGCDNDGVPRSGTPYGNPLLINLIGGSGGGGYTDGVAGSGGGGAILLSSQVSITHNGTISAIGGFVQYGGMGSGGAVRLRAPIVSGNGLIQVHGQSNNHGRIRVDAVDRSGIAFSFNPTCSYTSGSIMTELGTALGTLRLTEVGGNAIADNATGQVFVTLNAASPRTVKVRVHGFGGVVPVEIALTPDQGDRVTQVVNADMANADVDGNLVITATFPDFPVNVPTNVQAWTR